MSDNNFSPPWSHRFRFWLACNLAGKDMAFIIRATFKGTVVNGYDPCRNLYQFGVLQEGDNGVNVWHSPWGPIYGARTQEEWDENVRKAQLAAPPAEGGE